MDRDAAHREHVGVGPRAHGDSEGIEEKIEELPGLGLCCGVQRIQLQMYWRASLIVADNRTRIEKGGFAGVKHGHNGAAAISPRGK